MGRIEDGLGKKFGRLTVIEIIREKGKNVKYKCLCECGGEKTTYYNNLYYGRTSSCGCLEDEEKRKKGKPHYKKHGLSKSRLAIIRNGMISRCYNKKSANYNAYGRRGITICEEWKNKKTGMKNFYEWAVANGYKEGLTIERINVNGNYCPENCTWITKEEQKLNKRPYNYEEQKKYAFFNRELCCLLRQKGICPATIRQRMRKYGISFEQAIKIKDKADSSLPKVNKYLNKYQDKEKRVKEREKIIKKLRKGEL